jgi:hypothetical protein
MEDFFQKHESPDVYETRYVNHLTQIASIELFMNSLSN